jgi:glyceraldehyde-3-phosphate dehydrogenase/erythrose-4-phosphate dehydrogenase
MTLIGIVGFGHLGKVIYQYAKNEPHLDVAWVWNRSLDAVNMIFKISNQNVLTLCY